MRREFHYSGGEKSDRGKRCALSKVTQVDERLRCICNGNRKVLSTHTESPEEAGVLKTQQGRIMEEELKRAKKNGDYVIAYVHWGTEGKDPLWAGSDRNLQTFV